MKVRSSVMFMILFTICGIHCKAQECRISGQIIDESTGLPVEDVSVSCKIKGKLYSTMSDTLGHYLLTLPKLYNTVIRVSHLNYQPVTKLIIPKNRTHIEDFSLQPKNYNLQEVVVEANAPKVAQRNDTTVYFSNAYKVNRDATAYDLITQKLPGIGIRDGKLEAHGEIVKEILIDGKEYFRNDITMSLKNLPADVINEIQLFDNRSDYSKLTGFDDGTRKKTINITTKKGIKESVFGKALAGYGLDNYYKLYGMFNWFDDDLQLSIFAQANNTSEQNFSMIDLLSLSGTSMNTTPQQSPYSKGSSENSFHPATSNDISDMMMGGYSAGETITKAAGVNFSDIWGKTKNLSFTGHYMFNNAVNGADYDITDDYFNDGASTNFQTQYVHTNNTNHRFNSKIDYDLGDNSHLMFRPSILYQHQKEFTKLYISEEGTSLTDLIPLLEQEQNTDQKALTSSNELMFIQKFYNWGGSLSANLKFSYDNADENLWLELEEVQENGKSKQTTWSKNSAYSVATVGSYIQSLGKYFRIKADAGWNSSYRLIKRNTLRQRGGSQLMALDSMLSGKTSSDYGGMLAGLSVFWDKKHTQFVAGMEFHSYRIYSKNDITSSSVICPAFLPFLHFRHQWGKNSNQLHLQFKTDQTFPTTQQLQDAINNVNPTVAVRGNIYLKPSISHDLTLRLLLPGNHNKGIFVFFLNGEIKTDYIGNKRSIAGGALGAAETRSQLLSYINTNGFWSISTLIAYGFPFYLIRSNINLSSLIRYNHIPGFWENEKSYNNYLNWNSSLTIGSNISQNIDFVIDFNLQYLNDKNSKQPVLDVDYWTFSFGGQFVWQFSPHFKLTAECGRTAYYGLETKGFNAVIWNMSIAYKFLKNNRAELCLSCEDILDQNNYFAQQTNELFRRKTVANVIGRHGMLTFTYTFNSYKN